MLRPSQGETDADVEAKCAVLDNDANSDESSFDDFDEDDWMDDDEDENEDDDMMDEDGDKIMISMGGSKVMIMMGAVNVAASAAVDLGSMTLF